MSERSSSMATSSVTAHSSSWISFDRAMLASFDGDVRILGHDAERDVLAQQIPDLGLVGLRQVPRAQVRGVDRGRLLQHEPPSGVEPIGGDPHRDGEQEREKTEERANQRSTRPFLLVRVPGLPPAAQPEPDLEGEQRDEDEADEDTGDGDGIEHSLRHQLWAPDRLRTTTPSTIRVMPAMPTHPNVSRKNTTPMIAIAAVPMPGPHRVGDARAECRAA